MSNESINYFIKECECRKGGYSHAKTHIRYHIIFVTKYRRKCLNQIRDDVFDAFRECEKNSHIRILNMNIDKDHVHLLVTFPPMFSIGQTVRRLKQYTTKYLYDNNEEYLRNFYWKKKRLLWTHGYYCSTLGKISEDIVWNYIDNQGLK